MPDRILITRPLAPDEMRSPRDDVGFLLASYGVSTANGYTVEFVSRTADAVRDGLLVVPAPGKPWPALDQWCADALSFASPECP